MYYKLKGLVLNAKIQGEHDKLITIYSYECGKIYAVAPSAKKITAKLSYATEPLTESEFIVFNSDHAVRPKVTGANIIENNTNIKLDFDKMIHALYIAEVSDKFTPFYLTDINKYNLIVRGLELLRTCKYPKRILIAFVLRFLKLSGYAFSDYLKYNNNCSIVSKEVQKTIIKLSNCSGDELDLIKKLEDDRIWNYVESYLIKYVRRPLLSVFMKKLAHSCYLRTV
ncbi:MAG: DNA repair protein RecO [Endomicrobium sp.]|jgi:DNA repair protein RecO (recombination protein O)|nr:DNA repair protein RecO [Endomicrobium sp.]